MESNELEHPGGKDLPVLQVQIHSPNHQDKYCSHKCNSRYYKQLDKEEKIAVSNIQSSAIGLLKTKIDFPELSGKPFLTINESSALLNVVPVTLRRWIKEGMILTQRIGKKHIIKRTDIDVILA